MGDLLTILPLMLALLLAQGFFSGSEIALVSSDKLKLRSRAERGDKHAELVLKLFKKPETILATTLIGTNISTVILTVLGTATMIELLGTGGELYAILLLTPLMLIFGEVVPKSVYQQHADRIAPHVATLLAVIRALLLPLSLTFGWIGKQISKLVGPAASSPSPFVTRQRLRLMLDSADQAAELPVLDRDRIQRAVRLSGMTVGEAMVPLARVTGAPLKTTMRKLQTLSRRTGHRRIPLFEGNISNITRIASWSIWDELEPEFITHKVKAYSLKPHFTSPIERLDDLMPVLMARRDKMAVVVDEFGSAAGIVTVEDLMMMLLGDVAKGVHLGPGGWGEPLRVSRLDDDVIIMDAQARLPDAAELLDIELPTREFHTLGGFLTSHIGRIPIAGDSVEEFGYRFTVIEGTARAPEKIRIEPV
jgi:putative hemolysin